MEARDDSVPAEGPISVAAVVGHPGSIGQHKLGVKNSSGTLVC